MPKEKYKIAGLNVLMDVSGELTAIRSEKYKYNFSSTPDFEIIGMKSNIERMMRDEGLTEQEAEYVASGARFYNNLVSFGGFMLHSSAVCYNGKAYLFTADSGTGKSTHTSLWLELFPNAYIINDDKPAIRMVGDEFYVYGTPFSGKHDLSRNTKAKLGGICFIERAEENSVHKMDMNDVIFNMLTQTLRRFPKERMDKMLTLLDKLLSNVGVYKLCCNMDISAAKLSYETMSGEKCNG